MLTAMGLRTMINLMLSKMKRMKDNSPIRKCLSLIRMTKMKNLAIMTSPKLTTMMMKIKIAKKIKLTIMMTNLTRSHRNLLTSKILSLSSCL